jgi:hypothetical protein
MDIGRSKTVSLIFLDRKFGHLRLSELDRFDATASEVGASASVLAAESSSRKQLLPKLI